MIISCHFLGLAWLSVEINVLHNVYNCVILHPKIILHSIFGKLIIDSKQGKVLTTNLN